MQECLQKANFHTRKIDGVCFKRGIASASSILIYWIDSVPVDSFIVDVRASTKSQGSSLTDRVLSPLTKIVILLPKTAIASCDLRLQ